MSEWWTYTLQDFLLFSPRTYYRLFELYNAAIWPAQLLALGLGAWIFLLARREPAAPARGRLRVVSALLAAAWLWVAVAFLARRYATIQTAGLHFAWAFGGEAALLLGVGVFAGWLTWARPADLAQRAGVALFLFALVFQPLASPLLGRGWQSAEVFGVAPDPTAVGTLGILLAARTRHRWLLMIVPVLWCAITGAFLLAMKAPDWWVPPAAALFSMAAAILQRQEAAGRGRAEAPPAP